MLNFVKKKVKSLHSKLLTLAHTQLHCCTFLLCPSSTFLLECIVVNRTVPSAPRCDYNHSNTKNCHNVVFHGKYGLRDIKDLNFRLCIVFLG